MKEYIFIVILIFVGIIFLDLKVKKLKQIGRMVIGVIFFGVAGLGYKINSDWTVYEIIYNYVNVNNIKYLNLELGYKYLNILFNKWISFYQFKIIIFLSCFILIYLGLRKFLKKDQIFLWFALSYCYFGLFYNFYLSAIRQTIAVSLFIFSLQYLVLERNWIKYYICIFLACLFHMSALILIFLYFIFTPNFKIKSTKLLYYYLIMQVILNNKVVVNNFINLLTSFLIKLGISLKNFEYFMINSVSLRNEILTFLINIILIYIYVHLKSNKNYIINKFLFLYLISNLLANNIVIFYRVRLYFLPFYFIFLIQVYSIHHLKIFKYSFIILIIIVFNLSSINNLSKVRGAYVPLNFVYEKLYKEIPEYKTAEYRNLKIRFGQFKTQIEKRIIQNYFKR